jgi:hypothetical protein
MRGLVGIPRHEGGQVGFGRDRADTRSAAAMRDAEGLVQVQVGHIAAELAGLRQAHERVEVGTVHVDLAAGRMDGVADLTDVGVVNAVRGRVGDHDRRENILVRLNLGVQVRVVNRAVGGGGHDDHLHAGQHGRGGVGAVRRSRDQADVALVIAAGQVIAADRQQAGELTLGAGVRLDGHLVVPGDLRRGPPPGHQSVPASPRSGNPGRTGGSRRTPARKWPPSPPWRSASWCRSPAGSWSGPAPGPGRRACGCSAAAGFRSGAC